jgi:hypothetical protein
VRGGHARQVSPRVPPRRLHAARRRRASLIATSLYKKITYSFEKDLAPITVLAFVPNIVVTNPSVPAKNIRN